MNRPPKYQEIVSYIKKRIQAGTYAVDTFLPSEHSLCEQFGTTRTTVRKALDQLLKEGYIVKEQGKGSRVVERSRSLGLLTVKGFSGSTDYDLSTLITVSPKITDWPVIGSFKLTEAETASNCVYFQRIRKINGKAVVVENNWYANDVLELIEVDQFIDGSFFKTLNQRYFIDIMGAEQEIRSIPATKELSESLKIAEGTPILHITVRFRTSKDGLNLYGDLYCNTAEYPIHNSYFI